MISSDDHIRRQRQLQPATAGNAVDRRDDWFVQVPHLLHAAKAADAIVAVHGVAIGCTFQVPAGTKELFAPTCDDRDAQLWIIAKFGKDIAHDPGGGQINSVGFGPVEGHLENGPFTAGFDGRI